MDSGALGHYEPRPSHYCLQLRSALSSRWACFAAGRCRMADPALAKRLPVPRAGVTATYPGIGWVPPPVEWSMVPPRVAFADQSDVTRPAEAYWRSNTSVLSPYLQLQLATKPNRHLARSLVSPSRVSEGEAEVEAVVRVRHEREHGRRAEVGVDGATKRGAAHCREFQRASEQAATWAKGEPNGPTTARVESRITHS